MPGWTVLDPGWSVLCLDGLFWTQARLFYTWAGPLDCSGPKLDCSILGYTVLGRSELFYLGWAVLDPDWTVLPGMDFFFTWTGLAPGLRDE
jgi:hypothetical protein